MWFQFDVMCFKMEIVSVVTDHWRPFFMICIITYFNDGAFNEEGMCTEDNYVAELPL